MAEGKWVVGVIDTPGSTGSVDYPIQADALALIFYGTNFTTEDAVDTGNGRGMFRGMCGPEYDGSGLIQDAACVVGTPSGNAHSNQHHAIHMLNTGGGTTVLYQADVTALGDGEFTLNWTVAASGYKVIFIALIDVLEVGARIGMYNTTFALGFKAGASLLHGAWAGPIDGSDRTQEFYGGASYPGTSQSGWEGAGAAMHCFPTSAEGQYVNELSVFGPHIKVTTGVSFIGPFLSTSNIVAYPTGTGLEDMVMSGETEDGGMLLAWDDEDNRCFYLAPAEAENGTATKTGLPFEPGLLLGYTISNEPSGQGTGSRGALGFCVVADQTVDDPEPFQWCCTIDGVNQGAFQSFQRGFCDAVSGSGAHTGDVELTQDGFVLTTTDDTIARATIAWHVFGHPRPVWRPQIYRLVRSLP